MSCCPLPPSRPPSPPGKLLATLPAAQGRLDVVSAAAASPEHDHLVAGDTAGHLRVWDLRAGVDVSSMQVGAGGRSVGRERGGRGGGRGRGGGAPPNGNR